MPVLNAKLLMKEENSHELTIYGTSHPCSQVWLSRFNLYTNFIKKAEKIYLKVKYYHPPSKKRQRCSSQKLSDWSILGNY